MGLARRSVLRFSLLSLRYVGTRCIMLPERTLRLLPWPLSYRSCCLGPLMMRGPWPSGSCPTHKRARVKVRILMLVTLTKTRRSGMPSWSWPPQGSILHSFGNRIALWLKRWIMLTSSSTMKLSKRLPSAI